jgi:hypothetical protein
VITFSGCPGDCESSKYPNWVTCPWPPDFLRILDWQWNEKVIPYWQEEVRFCREHGVDMISLEMHPGFVVYNPETLLRLRKQWPDWRQLRSSHLFWQSSIALAIRALGGRSFMCAKAIIDR